MVEFVANIVVRIETDFLDLKSQTLLQDEIAFGSDLQFRTRTSRIHAGKSETRERDV